MHWTDKLQWHKHATFEIQEIPNSYAVSHTHYSVQWFYLQKMFITVYVQNLYHLEIFYKQYLLQNQNAASNKSYQKIAHSTTLHCRSHNKTLKQHIL